MTCWMDERTRDGGDRLVRPAAQTPMGDTLGLGECCGAGIHKYSSWMQVCSNFLEALQGNKPRILGRLCARMAHLLYHTILSTK